MSGLWPASSPIDCLTAILSIIEMAKHFEMQVPKRVHQFYSDHPYQGTKRSGRRRSQVMRAAER